MERAVDAREIECSVLGNDEPQASVPGEIVPNDEFYSYRAKYLDENGAELRIPADLDDRYRLSDQIPAHEIVKRGLIHCPERRRPFREMTVLENLHAGAYLIKDKNEILENLKQVYELFPILKNRSRQISGTLSGGEQQMLAIGRALMSEPKLLCIDEPSTGLAPIPRAEVFDKIAAIRKLGITILLVEQEVSTVFKMASRNYVLSSGKIIAEGPGDELLQNEVIRKTYLGL